MTPPLRAGRGRGPKSPAPAGSGPVPARRAWLAPLSLGAALLSVLATQYAGALAMLLMTDDYLILSRARGASWLSLWTQAELLMGFYRPWGREFHFWAIDRLFQAQPLAFHLAGFGLWLAILLLFHRLVRSLAGTAAATLATCLAATQAGWGALLIWAAGSQDLWMMAAGLLCLVAFARAQTALAAVALGISLLSKEAAATLPVIAFLYALIVERRAWGGAVRRTAGLWAVALAWALVHPLLGGLFGRSSSPVSAHAGWDAPAKLVAMVRALASADIPLAPVDGWTQALLAGIPAALLLAAATFIAFRLAPPAAEPARASSSPQIALWAACWMLLGWLPGSVPGLSWHAYYGLWGAFGAWLVIALALQRLPWVGVVLVIVLALLRPARAWTPQVDLGSEWYLSRAAMLTGAVHADLTGHRPTLPPHSRVFLAGLPGGVGLMPSVGDCPALRIWYRDPTLRGYFFSQYAPRAAADTLGGDFFFAFDSTGRSTEIIMGPEDLSRARGDPEWRNRHLELATLLFTRGNRAGCIAEFVKLVLVSPGDPSLLFALGACYEGMGDQAAAERCYRRAFALPGATPELQAIAREDWVRQP